TLSECMEIMARSVAESEKKNPARHNIVFCEDRLTLIAERAMTQKLGGSFRTFITTYARALKTRGRVLSRQGSVMVIDGIVAALQKEGRLKRFSRGGMPRGAAGSLYETITQSASSSVDAETLKAGAARLENGILKDKISDIAEIYAEYEKFLKQNAYVDESGYLALLPEYLKSTGEIDGADVYFLCYGSFTAQAAKTLKAAFERAATVTGIFCFGKEDFYTGSALSAFLKAAEEYSRENGNAAKIRATDMGVPLENEAEALRKGLFNPASFSRGKKKYPTSAIRLFEAEDKNDEAEKIAVAIKARLSRDPSLRYRDFAVLVSDIKGYTPAVKKAFTQYKIPFFLDEKRSLKTHPLSAFLLACFEAVKTGLSPQAADAVLANPFFGGADGYRNYLLKYANFRGGAKREIKSVNARGEEDGEKVFSREKKAAAPEYDEEELKAAREKLLALLSPVKRQARGAEYCEAVRGILLLSGAEARLKEMTERVDDVALKGYLGQIGGAIDRLLAECETLLGGREMSVAEFENVLSDGLEATEISLIPVKTDAVFVGDINESRIEKVRVLFAAGMNENVPKTTSDTALISDREIEKLAEVKAKMEPTVAEVNLRGREDTALNLCTFTEAAYFSYALPSDGTEAAVSEVLRYVSALFSNGEGGDLKIKKGWDEEDFIYRCSAPAPARLCFYERREQDEKNGVRYSPQCNALEQALARYEKDGAWAQAALLREDETGFVECGKTLFFRDGKISPSALETYFSCPFKHFLRYGLGVKEREEQSVMATDSGNFVHALLQCVAAKFSRFTSEEEVRLYARETGGELLKKPPYCYSFDTRSGEYAASRLLGEGVEAAAAAFRQVKGSLYRVAETEKTVETPFFRGKIDRVDETDEFV
ncbi:MAG: PD-(D/E)XK nuclease family protein, partial [Candidatus Scatosoma sp.]